MSLLLARKKSPSVMLLIVGVAALALWFVVALFWPHAAMRSYLFGYLFFIDLSLGMLGLLCLQFLSGGEWGRIVRRVAEAGAAALPVLGLLGLPLLVGAPWLFPWADTAQIAADPVIAHRVPWIGLPWVAGRSIVIFVVFIAVTRSLRRNSLMLDRTTPIAKPRIARRLQMVSRFGMVALFVGVSIWAVDFVMALEPHWVSTAFGMMMLCGQACTAMATIILAFAVLQRRSPTKLIMDADRVHDLGKLLLTTLVLWAYISFAQFLIQWLGNTQSDIPFFVHRTMTAWSWTGTALIFLHLGLPLALLLSEPRKRDLNRLASVALLIFTMRWLDTLWLVAPSSSTEAAGWVFPTDLLTPVAIGAIWLRVFIKHLNAAPIFATTYETSGANESGLVTVEVPHAG